MSSNEVQEHEGRNWVVALTSFAFIVLQSACTLAMSISGARFLISLGALALASVLHTHGLHRDTIRIPMMVLALVGSFANLYVIWRLRSLRARPSSQWRVRPVTPQQKRAENIQIAISVLTLLLVAAEEISHIILHRH